MTKSYASIHQALATYRTGTDEWTLWNMVLKGRRRAESRRYRDNIGYHAWYRGFLRRHGMGINKIADLLDSSPEQVKAWDGHGTLARMIKLRSKK